jgi:hypothetical protein
MRHLPLSATQVKGKIGAVAAYAGFAPTDLTKAGVSPL